MTTTPSTSREPVYGFTASQIDALVKSKRISARRDLAKAAMTDPIQKNVCVDTRGQRCEA